MNSDLRFVRTDGYLNIKLIAVKTKKKSNFVKDKLCYASVALVAVVCYDLATIQNEC